MHRTFRGMTLQTLLQRLYGITTIKELMHRTGLFTPALLGPIVAYDGVGKATATRLHERLGIPAEELLPGRPRARTAATAGVPGPAAYQPREEGARAQIQIPRRAGGSGATPGRIPRAGGGWLGFGDHRSHNEVSKCGVILPIGREWKEGRMTELIETAPKMDLAIEDIEHLVEELRAYHAIYSPLFQRREQRDAAYIYRRGLLAALPRKSIEPLVLAVEGVVPPAVRALQAFISEGRWADERLLHQHWKEVERDLGADDGVLMVDGSDVPKQGVHSAGVKRQYCGELGKRANCQAGVCVGYVSPTGYTLLDRRLYLPEEWVTDDAYAERRTPCGIPPESTFKTKPALAQEMIAEVVKTQACGAAGSWWTRRSGTTRAFWTGWRDWACGMLPKCPIPRGSGASARPHTSHRGLGEDAARSGSAWWLAHRRCAQCWR